VGAVEGVRRPTARARDLRNAATPAERLLWRYIGASKLGVKFSRQMPVGEFVCDFLSRSHRLAIELDGYSHDIDPERDERRDAFLKGRGLRVLHFTNAEVMGNIEGVVRTIEIALTEQAPPPTPPASGRGEEEASHQSPLPPAGGVGGGPILDDSGLPTHSAKIP
jgi:very-short-patch-repair endonuclease